MTELPHGSVTFVFTDIEGSTLLVKQLRGQYPEVLAEHQRILREAFANHGGYEVDTQGDAFFAAFASARDAVLAALEAQRVLSDHAWSDGTRVRVRIGIHTGQAMPVGGRYTGVAVHRAARISAAAHGGQVLVSQTTHNLLEDEEEDLPGIALRDLGTHELKDLDRPVHVYQVEAEGLEREFPPLRTEAHAPAAAPPPPYYRRRTILVGAVAGVIAAAVAIPIFAFGGGSGGGGLGEATGNAIGSIDAHTGDVEGGVMLPGAPTAVAAGLGSVWAASADSNKVYAIDPDSNTVRDRIDVGNAPAGIATGGGFVWVTNSLAGTVSQISPQGQIVEEVRVGNGPTGIAFGGGYVWVANTLEHTISRIRVRDGKVWSFSATTDPGAIAYGERAIWVASKSSNTVVKLDPRDGQRLLRPIPVGQGPAGIAVGLGSVWVANSDDGTVSRIDPATGSVTGLLPVGSGPSSVAIVGREVWTANELAGTVSRIDPARTERPTTVRLGRPPAAVTGGDDTVYVALRPTGMAHRGGTLTVVVAADIPLPTLDPAVGSFSPLFGFVDLTNDGLLAYRHVSGQAGSELVPDLAVSMPDVSSDGKSYRFQLRPNIRYSNGDPLRAKDFRYAIERVFKLRPHAGDYAPLLGIRGADRCARRSVRRRCNLAAGVLTDDAARTVTFNLTAPDPYFLYKLLSSSTAAVPAGTSLREAKRGPLPATGPYRLASFTSRSVRLVRNPHFREWSKAAQPVGFPDEIVLRAVLAQEDRIALVEHGKSDLTSSFVGQPFPVSPAFRPWLHPHPALFTIYLALDTTRPPFDDLRARRAVNYALDRNKIVRIIGGEDLGRPTCQVLPPNSPGHRRYCPYTLDQRADGSWTAPDPAKATRLIDESGTAGTRVTLWVPDATSIGLGRYLKGIVQSLGYRVHLRSSFKRSGRLDESDSTDPFRRYFIRLETGAMSNQRRDSPQIAWSGWAADYPASSAFIGPLFSCGSRVPNYAHFCDRALEQKIRRAAELEQTDRAAANRRWAELDREITDKALLIPLYNTYGADLVSRRVGNYQYNPQYGTILSQIWVR